MSIGSVIPFASLIVIAGLRGVSDDAGEPGVGGPTRDAVGAGAFAKAYGDHATRPNDIYRSGGVKVYHAHQVYFAMGAETGWPGLLGLLAAIGLCVKWYRAASPERRDQAWPYALGLAVYFFPVNTQQPLYHGNWLFPVMLLLIAALLAALDGEPSAKGANAPQPGG